MRRAHTQLEMSWWERLESPLECVKLTPVTAVL